MNVNVIGVLHIGMQQVDRPTQSAGRKRFSLCVRRVTAEIDRAADGVVIQHRRGVDHGGQT